MVFNFFIFLSSLRNLFIYFAIAISLPSMVLYIFEIITIIRHKKFHNPFYCLVIIRSIPNILYTLDSYYCYRLTVLFGTFLYPFYSQLPNWMLRLSYFLTFYTMIADFLATILILLNRWTAITMGMTYKQPIYDAFPLNVCYCIVFITISILINIGTFVSYRRHKKRISGIKSSTQEINEARTEYKLLLYAIFTFIGHADILNRVLTYLVVNSNNFDLIAAVYTQYPWTMDVGSVIMPSWLLFWASDNFRSQMILDFCPNFLKRLIKLKTKESTTIKVLQTTKVEPIGQRIVFSV
ncbi:Serpentine receptor class gamma [Meloidogyne graminicola]|uniref:Serpentine receptor class gamma n=1 Tax=Meloidogyne graminicola TaxID=189291 RepID=A0A8T0A3F1_9BILA|nr:Serpentine receptor class gamma [Meloidogyne graminicola]